jgi:hypothetical protein
MGFPAKPLGKGSFCDAYPASSMITEFDILVVHREPGGPPGIP